VIDIRPVSTETAHIFLDAFREFLERLP